MSSTVAERKVAHHKKEDVAFKAQLSYSGSVIQSQQVKPVGTSKALTIAGASLVAVLACLNTFTSFYGVASILTSVSVSLIAGSLLWNLSTHHEHGIYGLANEITTARAASATILAGFIPIASQLPSASWFWAIALVATITLCLDGLDGYFARKTGLSSAFGARFDMETDAFLALVITLFLWQSERAGIWILGLGLMRYIFILAAFRMRFLRIPLYPSIRRKTVCVIQVGALCLMLCPWLSAQHVEVIGLIAMACLLYSFSTDVHWLFRRRHSLPDR